MKIKFLGTGGAFEPAYGNSAAIIQINGRNILLDAGFTVYPKLVELNLWPEIDTILLTHLHNDHCGSLANILLHCFFYKDQQKPTILFPSEAFREQLVLFLNIQLKDAEAYANFRPLSEVPGISFLDTYNLHSEGFQTYSYIFEEESNRIVYSGDLRECQVLFNYLNTLPLMSTTVYHDIGFHPENKGHAHYTALMPYLGQYSIFGYHCNPVNNPPENTIPLVYNQPGLCY